MCVIFVDISAESPDDYNDDDVDVDDDDEGNVGVLILTPHHIHSSVLISYSIILSHSLTRWWLEL